MGRVPHVAGDAPSEDGRTDYLIIFMNCIEGFCLMWCKYNIATPQGKGPRQGIDRAAWSAHEKLCTS
jgi:hypothetical protein